MTEHTIKLTEQQLQIVGAGLGELPFKIAAPVINEIQKQVNEAKQEKSPPEKRVDWNE